MPTPSDISIANLALTGLGDARISDFSDESEQARAINAIYSLVRDEVLSAHPWSFAVKRAKLSKLSSTPEYGWANEFQIPADCLRILSSDLDENDYKWVREGDRILTDQSEVRIEYIQRITDPTKFSASFITAFSARLEVELAYTLSQNLTLGGEKYKIFLLKLSTAKAIDAQESGLKRQLHNDAWINSRGTGQI